MVEVPLLVAVLLQDEKEFAFFLSRKLSSLAFRYHSAWDGSFCFPRKHLLLCQMQAMFLHHVFCSSLRERNTSLLTYSYVIFLCLSVSI